MKVLLFSGRFEVRGTSAYTLRLARHLGGHGVTPKIVCPSARLIDPVKRADLSISEYPHLGIPLWGRVVRNLMRRDVAVDPPDLIHIQSRHVLAHGAWLARRLERPWILTVHDYLLPRERLRIDPRWGRRIVAVSESVRTELLGRVDLPDEAVRVIRGGVEVAEETAAPPVLAPGQVPVIGTAGPLEAVKGLPFFLGAAARVLSVRPDVSFLVSGAGPEEGNLRRLAQMLGIQEQVTFIPNQLDFSHALAAMDIFCLTSLRQGLGTIMLEAMALGRPVIATGVGGVYSAVRDNETGLMVPPSDSARLAERILELLADPHRARAIGHAARRLVQQEFAVERMVRETAEMYREVLEVAEPGGAKRTAGFRAEAEQAPA